MIAGIGCRTGVSEEGVEAAIDAAIAALYAIEAAIAAASGSTAHRRQLAAIATPAAKTHEAGIQAAATARRVPVLAIAQADLEAANATTVTRSAHSMRAMNVHSVAEAAALAGVIAVSTMADGDAPGRDATPRLLLPRITVGPVTCALADTSPT